MSDRTELLRQIKDEVINLTESPLYEYRTSNGYFPVIGQGSHYAKIMFIGEAPGENEAKTGIPFCGRSGKLLDEMLESVGIAREDVYITNIVKDRPPKNRDPQKGEIDLYVPFLERQIDIIQPEVIATLGRYSMVFILKKFGAPEAKAKISAIHGTLINVQASYGEIKVLPLFHPASALYSPLTRDTHFEDFKMLEQFK